MTEDAQQSPSSDSSHGRSGWAGTITVDVGSEGPVSEVIERCREALSAITATVTGGDPFEAVNWQSVLPSWLLDASEPEPTPDGGRGLRRQMQGLSPDRRVELARTLGWTVSDLVSWFKPRDCEHLEWYATVVDDHHAVIRVNAHSFRSPFPAVLWLLRAAGAAELRFTDERPLMIAANRDDHPLAPKLSVPGVDQARWHLLEITDELIQQFGLDRDEAIGRVNEYFAGLTYLSRDGATMLTHEDPEDWAKTVYYGRSSYWWVPGRNPQQPLPYPGFDRDLHGR